LAKIAAYKFVNPGVASAAAPEVKAARTQLLATNRVGSTVEGIGNIFVSLNAANKSLLVFQKEADEKEKKKLRRQRDLQAEAVQENARSKSPSQRDKLAEEQDLDVDEDEGNGFVSWFEKTFAPIANIFKDIATIFIAKGVTEWLSDPENREKLKTFVEKAGYVFGVLKDFVEDRVLNVLDGFKALTDPENSWWERLKGLGSILLGVIGLKYLMNPFSLITDILGLVSAITGIGGGDDGTNKPKKPKGGDKPKKPKGRSKPKKPKGRSKPGVKPGTKPPVTKPGTRLSPFQLEQARKGVSAVDDVVPPGAKPNLLQRLWNRTADGSKDLFRRGKDSFTSMGNWWAKNSKAFIDGAKGIGKGVYNWGADQAKSIKNLAALAKDPAKLKDVVGKKLKDGLKPIIEKDDGIKKIFEIVKNPKQMGSSLIDTFQKIIKSPATKKGVNFLKEARKNVKIGGLDAVLASLFALLDYGVFGESPINAIVTALGSLLGYSAGFAIGAPFGGIPGFITGAVGGVAGEFVAGKVLEGLAKTFPQLTEIEDPVAKQLFPNAPRSILRDPSAPMELSDDQQKALEDKLPKLDDLEKKATGGLVIPKFLEQKSAGGMLKGTPKTSYGNTSPSVLNPTVVGNVFSANKDSNTNIGGVSPSEINSTNVGGVSPATAGKSPVRKQMAPKINRAPKSTIGNYKFSTQYAIIKGEENAVPIPMPIVMPQAVPVAYPINTSQEVVVIRPSPLINK
jgi:hypothetical protein